MSSEQKQHILEVVNEFLKLAADVGDTKAQERIQVPLVRYRLGLFRIVVVGEIKKGKSSFINALLGQPDLLPAASDVATSTVYKIMYGKPRRTKVFFSPKDPDDETSRPEAVEISPADVPVYGTEDRNPGNKKGVDFIGMQAPHPLLKDGIAIVDTPGLGGLFAKHRDITWRYLPNADAVFFVMDSVEAVASKAEMELLKKIRDLTPLVFFVQTKTDLVDETQWKQWRERNLAILEETLGVPKAKLLYFPVSAQLKLDADADHDAELLEISGFVPLTHFIQHKLLPRKEGELRRTLIRTLGYEVSRLDGRLREKAQITSEQDQSKLAEIRDALTQEKRGLDAWLRTDFVRVQQAAQENLRRLIELDGQKEIEDQYGPQGAVLRGYLAELRGRNLKAKEIEQQAPQIQQEFINRLAEAAYEFFRGLETSVQRVIGDAIEELGKSFVEQSGLISDEESLVFRTSLSQVKLRTGLVQDVIMGNMGVNLGRTAVALLFGAASFVFPVTVPFVVAGAICSLGGGVAGFFFTKRSRDSQKQQDAMLQIERCLMEVATSSLTQIRQKFRSLNFEATRLLQRHFKTCAQAMKGDAENRISHLEEVQKETAEQRAERSEELSRHLVSSQKLIEALASLVEQAKPVAKEQQEP